MGRRGKFLLLLGLFGAALLYADGMITPAISVLSAVEGLHVATPLFDPYVVPVAIGILVGALHLSITRHDRTRPRLRTGHDSLVPGDRGSGDPSNRPGSGSAGRNQSASGGSILQQKRRNRFRGSWRGFPGSDGRRSALRRHRPLRHRADSDHLVRGRAAGVNFELFRPGRSSSQTSRCSRESLFQDGACLGALPDGGSRDRRRHHRVAGYHQRRLFADDAGDPARLHAAAARELHLRASHRPDLRPGGELGAHAFVASASFSALARRAISPRLMAWRLPRPC